MHWHENLELLYFVDGVANVTCNTEVIQANEGDIVFINSNYLHYIESMTDYCKYHCLIVDKNFCESFDINVDNTIIQSLINNKMLNEFFNTIITEMSNKSPYYKSIVKIKSIELLLHIYRNFVIDKNNLIDTSSNKLRMVKEGISYIRAHYKENITIDDICKSIGFSKYYFCRTFKEITGKTVIDYVNFLRCDNARKLLCSGNYNVSESAEVCGFKNLSYFSKTYKSYMGKLPSTEYKS